MKCVNGDLVEGKGGLVEGNQLRSQIPGTKRQIDPKYQTSNLKQYTNLKQFEIARQADKS
jgi:hypothetical protein